MRVGSGAGGQAIAQQMRLGIYFAHTGTPCEGDTLELMLSSLFTSGGGGNGDGGGGGVHVHVAQTTAQYTVAGATA